MNVEYSKPFLKAVDKLSGKVLSSVLDMIREVKNANGMMKLLIARNLLLINQHIGFV
jgi:mRNA-degrading endonuclease RelE of RelBE toxin-antitoxin system